MRSLYQLGVNWQTVARGGILFGFVKLTPGATLVCSTFTRNWTAVKAASIQSGADRFFRPTSSIRGQINLFPKAVKLAAGDLPAVWELEATGSLSAGELGDRATIAELSDKVIANIKVF